MKLDDHGSTIYQLVSLDKYSIRTKISYQRQTSDIVSPVSWINTLELWWNLISVETHEQFQHLSFHDGWWKNMTTERTWLWLTLFSRIYHLIDSWWKRCSEKSRAGKSAIQDLGSMSTSGCNAHDDCLREARWLINHIFDIQWSLFLITQPPWHEALFR